MTPWPKWRGGKGAHEIGLTKPNGMIGIGAKINHTKYGEGVIFGDEGAAWRIFFQDHGEKGLAKTYESYEILEPAPENSGSGIALEDVVSAVENVFEQYLESPSPVDLGDKWEGGMMSLQPGDSALQKKDIPIEAFFHKIVMLRDRLRVLEQSINAHKVLTDEDKVGLQQYITRCYGSLTTFNILFERKEDHFKGGGK